MLLEKNVVGKQEDWAKFITNVDGHKTPFLSLLPVGDKPTNVVFDYLVDDYEEPVEIAHPDGKDWNVFGTAGKNVARLDAVAQEMYVTASVSRKAQDITDVKAINDQLAFEIEKKFVELARTTESQFLSDLDCYRDDGVKGDETRGAGRWINSAAQTLFPVPAPYRTPAASIYSDTIALFTEDKVRDLLESIWGQTGQSSDSMTGLVGPKLKRKISDFQFYIPSSMVTQSTSRVNNRDQESNKLVVAIDIYDSDFGNLELRLENWNAHPNFGGTAGKRAWRGYIIHPKMWQLRWHTKPTVYKPDFMGGSYKAVIDQIVMLVCKNPQCEGKIDPSDA